MNRRTAIRRLATFFLTTASLAEAQQPKKVPRIGYLTALDAATETDRSEAIRLSLRERGYIEGQNIVIEYRYGEGKRDRLPALAAELVRLNVDVIVVAGGDLPIRAAMDATKTVPIVMTGSGSDPVAAGFIASLARPGGNVTGVTRLGRDLGGKRLELLKETVPKLARVAFLYGVDNPANLIELKDILPASARALKLTIEPWEVRDVDGIEKAFAAMVKRRADGLYLPGGGALIRSHLKQIAALAVKSRLPSTSNSNGFAVEGGLMT